MDKKKVLIIISVIFILGAAGAAAYFGFLKEADNTADTTPDTKKEAKKTLPPPTKFDNGISFIQPDDCRTSAGDEEKQKLEGKVFPSSHFVIDNSHNQNDIYAEDFPYRLEGIVREGADAVYIEYKNERYTLENFEAGSTRFCIVLEEGLNIRQGENRYVVDVHYDTPISESYYEGPYVSEDEKETAKNENFARREIIIITSQYRGEIEQEADLSVEWNTELEGVNIEDYIPGDFVETVESSGGFNDGPTPELFRAGTVTSEDYRDGEFLIMNIPCQAFCSHRSYRFVYDGERMILLSKISTDFDRDYRYFVYNAPNIDVPDLHYPEVVDLSNFELDMVAEDYSPDMFFSGAEERYNLEPVISTHVYGALYESKKKTEIDESGQEYETGLGSFTLRLPDGTVKLYQFEMPGNKLNSEELAEQGYFVGGTTYEIDIQLSEGGSFSGNYSSATPVPCPPVKYMVTTGESADERFEKIGTAGGTDIYRPADENDELYKNTSKKTFINGETVEYSDEEFYELYPVITWRDPLGRWISMVNIDTLLGAETECGVIRSVL